jgi:hypothetical protein
MPSVVTGATLERMLLVALAFPLLGCVAIAWAVWYWASLKFGSVRDTSAMHALTVGLLLVAVSIQIASGTLLASIFDIRRK